ncbi:hypothetical protein [Streptomyces monomycini]|uniref:hypothetical protein n=1 Tax=Streptomyces monomycini TaxID=371720 RepID=UPI001EEB90E2|nr:hypothetical protein [Streptomyces monomycini]
MTTRSGPPPGGGPPPEAEVHWVYQPVELQHPDGGWELGRITAWWRDGAGELWCRLRTMRGSGGSCPQWFPYDPDRILVLPSAGI